MIGIVKEKIPSTPSKTIQISSESTQFGFPRFRKSTTSQKSKAQLQGTGSLNEVSPFVAIRHEPQTIDSSQIEEDIIETRDYSESSSISPATSSFYSFVNEGICRPEGLSIEDFNENTEIALKISKDPNLLANALAEIQSSFKAEHIEYLKSRVTLSSSAVVNKRSKQIDVEAKAKKSSPIDWDGQNINSDEDLLGLIKQSSSLTQKKAVSWITGENLVGNKNIQDIGVEDAPFNNNMSGKKYDPATSFLYDERFDLSGKRWENFLDYSNLYLFFSLTNIFVL
jgi:hypothetical protein